MHIPIPDDWRPVTKVDFQRILSVVNWRKDEFGFYVVAHTHPPQQFAIEMAGQILIDPAFDE
jgi:hypothetical protein